MKNWPGCKQTRSSRTRALNYLADFSFSGDAWGFLEGDVYFANSPIFTVESTFAEAVVLETVLLSIFNYDSAVASAVAPHGRRRPRPHHLRRRGKKGP